MKYIPNPHVGMSSEFDYYYNIYFCFAISLIELG